MNTAAKLPLFSPQIKNLNKATGTVTIKMDKRSVSQISGRLTTYKSLPEKFRPAMENIADYVRGTMIPYTFEKEGPGWKPLAKRTVREREAKGYGGRHPILKRTEDLYKELTDKQHPKHVEVIKVGKRSRIEIGGSSQKFLENQLGKTQQRLPPRAMIPGTGSLPLLDRDRLQMASIIKKAFNQATNKTT